MALTDRTLAVRLRLTDAEADELALGWPRAGQAIAEARAERLRHDCGIRWSAGRGVRHPVELWVLMAVYTLWWAGVTPQVTEVEFSADEHWVWIR